MAQRPLANTLYNQQMKLQGMFEKQKALLEKRQKLLNAPVVNLTQFNKTLGQLDKINLSLDKQKQLVANLGYRQLNNAVSQVTTTALAASAAFGAILIKTAQAFSPNEAIRFQYRMEDLSATVGSVLAPSFGVLSDSVYKLSKFMYNLDDPTKQAINSFGMLAAKIAAVVLGAGALLKVGSMLGGVAKGLGAIMGVSTAMAGPMAMVGKVAAFAGLAGGAGIAAGAATGSAKVGGAVTGGMLGAKIGTLILPGIGTVVGGLLGAIGGSIVGGSIDRKIAKIQAGNKDPQGLAPREIQSFSSVLDPGRKLRMQSLATAGLPKEDESTMQARAQATLDAINAAQQRALNIWVNLGKVMEQQAQNNLAR